MKKISTLAVILFTTLTMYCQTPELMSYQAVVRDADSELLADQAVGMKISILEDTASGTPVYVETQNPSTNSNGLLSLQVGAGTVVSGDITTIDWANHDYFIKTETDPTGGENYTIAGTSQILSVPYALLSKNVINDLVDDADNDPSNEYNTGFTFNGTDLEITDGGSVQTVDLSVLDNTNLQAELDTTQTGAGLATDGTYSANTTANYIAGATALNDADDKLDTQAKVNADAISANNTQISANTTAISTNTSNIATNVTDIAGNTTAISTNATDIATNVTDIATNATDIATNVTDIAANVTAISTNTDNIATNGTDIATNVTAISTNASGISTNATDIATNVTAISTNASGIATNGTDIATNGTAISTNATDIAANSTAISTNTTDITTNATDIATNVTDIATNATDIATNATDIATNVTDIATNVTAIALNTAKDTNVSTDLTITGTTGARVIVSSDGTDATIPVATAVVSGVMSKATYDEHLINTAKTGITTDQATAISTNTSNIATNVTDILTNASGITTNATDIATNVTDIALKANIVSPTLTGTPLAPTATAGDSSTAIATTAFVTTAVSTATSGSFVDLTTDQTIAGSKTFSSDISVNGVKIGRGIGDHSENTVVGSGALGTGTGQRNTALGRLALGSYSGSSFDNNTAVGYNNSSSVSTGQQNTSIGAEAMLHLTTGSANTAIGAQSLINTTGSNNTSLGYAAGQIITSGNNNTFLGKSSNGSSATLSNSSAIGYEATVAASNTIQLGNTSITNVKTSGTITAGAITIPNTDGTANQVLKTDGSGALTWSTPASSGATNINGLSDALVESNSIYLGKDPSGTTDNANYNVSVGISALNFITTGDNNVAVGFQSLYANTTGYSNTAIGDNVMRFNIDGFRNTAIGTYSLYRNTTGQNNVSNGGYSLHNNTTGSNSSAFGYKALYNSTGSNNTGIGYQAGDLITTGTNNVIIGKDADPSANTANNQIVIGYNATGAGDNTVQLGNTSITNVKTSGTVTAGAVTYINSVGTNGQVLTTDGAGATSWADTSRTYSVNTFYAELGGYVIQISPNGKHGLVVAMQDQGPSGWYKANDLLSDPSNHDADGKEFSDWRMPTKRELNLVYVQKARVGNFSTNYYWSSTESDNNSAWEQYFFNGDQNDYAKDSTFSVRAVRAF